MSERDHIPETTQPGEGVAGLRRPRAGWRPPRPADADQVVDPLALKASTSAANGGWSLTAPVWFTGSQKAEFLGCGVDSLDLGLYVDWQCDLPPLQQAFEDAKKAASGTDGRPFGTDGACLMLPAGKNRFPWHLQYPEFHLFISRRESWFGDTPNLLVSLNSHTLWQRWVAGSVDLVKERVRELGGVVKGVRPSRCDLAADYYIPGGLLEADLVRHRCPRHFKRQGISDGDRLETWYVGGATSPVRLRIYDKGREILRDGRKLWFLDVWNRESVEGVWRVEFQVRRDVLRRYRLNSMADLQSHLCGLWDYLTEDWFSLRELDNEHTTRRSVTPWWQHVQSLGLKFGDRKPLERRLVSQCADLRWYVSHIAGCLKTLAALRGKFALDEALLDLEALLRAKLHPAKFMEEVRIRCIKLGIPVPKV